MGNIDEKIAKAINEYKTESYGTIESGVFIKEELIQFERVELFEGKIALMLPKNFKDMPLEMQEMKYPSVHRPQIIKSNERGDINFAFSLLDSPLEKTAVQETTKQMKKLVRKVQPSNVFHDEGMFEKENITIGWFDYKSPTMDEALFNIMYCGTVNGKMLHGVFNTLYSDWKLWKNVMIDIIGTIECLC